MTGISALICIAKRWAASDAGPKLVSGLRVAGQQRMSQVGKVVHQLNRQSHGRFARGFLSRADEKPFAFTALQAERDGDLTLGFQQHIHGISEHGRRAFSVISDLC